MSGVDWTLSLIFILFVFAILAQIPIYIWAIIIAIFIIRGLFK
jgi:hypothetical protein